MQRKSGTSWDVPLFCAPCTGSRRVLYSGRRAGGCPSGLASQSSEERRPALWEPKGAHTPRPAYRGAGYLSQRLSCCLCAARISRTGEEERPVFSACSRAGTAIQMEKGTFCGRRDARCNRHLRNPRRAEDLAGGVIRSPGIFPRGMRNNRIDDGTAETDIAGKAGRIRFCGPFQKYWLPLLTCWSQRAIIMLGQLNALRRICTAMPCCFFWTNEIGCLKKFGHYNNNKSLSWYGAAGKIGISVVPRGIVFAARNLSDGQVFLSSEQREIDRKDCVYAYGFERCGGL